MREMHCAVHCHVNPMARSLFSAYVESGLQAARSCPRRSEIDARKLAVERAAARPRRRRCWPSWRRSRRRLPRARHASAPWKRWRARARRRCSPGSRWACSSARCYTIYKAATAVVLAEALAVETGTPVVPIFWMATEDHDFAEVDHCTVARGSTRRSGCASRPTGAPRRARRWPRRGSAPTSPTRSTRCARPIAGRPAAPRSPRCSPRDYTPAARFGDGLRRSLLAALFADEGLLVFHPRTPGVAALAAPAYRHALLHAGAIADWLVARDAALAAAGFDAQVHVRSDAALVFAARRARRPPTGTRSRTRRRAPPTSPPIRLRFSSLGAACARSCRTRSSRRRPTSAARRVQLLRAVAPPSTTSSICPSRWWRRARASASSTADARAPRRARPWPADVEQPLRPAAERSVGARGPRRCSPASCAPPSSTPRSTRSRPCPRASATPIATSARLRRTRATIERAVERLTARYARTLALARRARRRRAPSRAGAPLPRRRAARARLRLPLVRRRRRARAHSSREYSAPIKPFDPPCRPRRGRA